MRYITFEQAKTIPAFQGKTPAQVAGVVADATLVWRYIQGHAWATDAEIAAYVTAPAQGLTTDRLNAAVQLLRDTQRVFGFEDTPIITDGAPAALLVVQQQPGPATQQMATAATQVWVQLSQALDASSVTSGSLVVADGNGPVPGPVAYEPQSLRVVFTPDAPLQPGAYSATLAGTIKNGGGLLLGDDVSWDFTLA